MKRVVLSLAFGLISVVLAVTVIPLIWIVGCTCFFLSGDWREDNSRE